MLEEGVFVLERGVFALDTSLVYTVFVRLSYHALTVVFRNLYRKGNRVRGEYRWEEINLCIEIFGIRKGLVYVIEKEIGLGVSG